MICPGGSGGSPGWRGAPQDGEGASEGGGGAPQDGVGASWMERISPGTDWFQIGKGVCQGWILSPFLFNLYAEYIMRNAGLDELQAGIKIARRNINSLRYADTTLMAESEEELKSLLMRVKEESEKTGLKFNIQKTKSATIF